MQMNRHFLLLILALITFNSEVWGQGKTAAEAINPADLATLQQEEAKLKALFTFNYFSPKIYDTLLTTDSVQRNDQNRMNRLADSICRADTKLRAEKSKNFVPQLVNALKTPNSFYYTFDSLKVRGLSVLYPSDNSFRIITWAVPQNKYTGTYTYEYYGAIQYNSPELRLTGLTDKSAEMGSPEIKTTDASEWFGALYYGITQVSRLDTTYYVLFGWDGHNDRSTKKLADVLYFDNGKAMFGAPIFEVPKDNKLAIKKRFILEYKEGAVVSLNFDVEQNMIMFDQLTDDEDAKKSGKKKKTTGTAFNLVPEGNYSGLQFRDGLWRYLPTVMRSTLQSAPVSSPKLGGGRKAGGFKPNKAKNKK
jgi:hypothetical protein